MIFTRRIISMRCKNKVFFFSARLHFYYRSNGVDAFILAGRVDERVYF